MFYIILFFTILLLCSAGGFLLGYLLGYAKAEEERYGGLHGETEYGGLHRENRETETEPGEKK